MKNSFLYPSAAFLFVALSSFINAAKIELKCKDYVLQGPGSGSSQYAVRFQASQYYGGSPPFSTIPAFISPNSENWKLSDNNISNADTFHVETCNSTALQLESSIYSTCSHNGCSDDYSDYIRIHRASDQACLTYNPRVGVIQSAPLSWKPCRQTMNQFFEAQQVVLYSTRYGSNSLIKDKVRNWGSDSVFVDLVQSGRHNSIRLYIAWYLDPADNKTVITTKDNYTSRGLDALLVRK